MFYDSKNRVTSSSGVVSLGENDVRDCFAFLRSIHVYSSVLNQELINILSRPFVSGMNRRNERACITRRQSSFMDYQKSGRYEEVMFRDVYAVLLATGLSPVHAARAIRLGRSIDLATGCGYASFAQKLSNEKFATDYKFLHSNLPVAVAYQARALRTNCQMLKGNVASQTDATRGLRDVEKISTKQFVSGVERAAKKRVTWFQFEMICRLYGYEVEDVLFGLRKYYFDKAISYRLPWTRGHSRAKIESDLYDTIMFRQ